MPLTAARFLKEESVRKCFAPAKELQYYMERYPTLLDEMGSLFVKYANNGKLLKFMLI
jgi:hypothetical protein